MALGCPLCGAKPGQVCETKLGIELEAIHLERIKAAARKDVAAKKARKKAH
jgi:hypothetical protein